EVHVPGDIERPGVRSSGRSDLGRAVKFAAAACLNLVEAVEEVYPCPDPAVALKPVGWDGRCSQSDEVVHLVNQSHVDGGGADTAAMAVSNDVQLLSRRKRVVIDEASECACRRDPRRVVVFPGPLEGGDRPIPNGPRDVLEKLASLSKLGCACRPRAVDDDRE